jgi:hypothetical protein
MVQVDIMRAFAYIVASTFDRQQSNLMSGANNPSWVRLFHPAACRWFQPLPTGRCHAGNGYDLTTVMRDGEHRQSLVVISAGGA